MAVDGGGGMPGYPKTRHVDAIKPYYEAAVHRYLSGVGEQVRNPRLTGAVYAEDLFASLQEMQVLLQATTCAGSGWSTAVDTTDLSSDIDKTYQIALDEYLKQTNPSLANQLEAKRNESDQRRANSDRKRSADAMRGGFGTGVESRGESQEDDGDDQDGQHAGARDSPVVKAYV
jgi:hypothetical protein